MRPLLSLVVMVKNEAPTIAKTLESAKPFVDRFTVLDTVSTDGTRDVVRRAMEGVPGCLFQEPFVDYATSRNQALDIEGKEAVFTLFLSADETLHGGDELRAFLEQHRDASEGAYCVTMQTGSRTWPYTRVLRTDAKWRYLGKIHERPVGPNGETTGPLIPGVKVIYEGTDPQRKAERLRNFDLPVLTAEVEDESKSLEERAQAIFFLAETHTLLARDCLDAEGRYVPGGPYLSHQMTAMALYFRFAHIAMPLDENKALYALTLFYHLAEPGQANFYTSAELLERVQKISVAAPQIHEAGFLLAKHGAMVDPRKGLFFAHQALKAIEKTRGTLRLEVVDASVEWRCCSIGAACAKATGDIRQAKSFAERGLAVGGPKEAFEKFLEVV